MNENPTVCHRSTPTIAARAVCGSSKAFEVMDPELAQVVGNKAEVGVQGVLGDQRHDGPRDEDREEYGGPQTVTQSGRHLPVDGQGEAEAHRDVEHYAGDSELGGH